MPFLQFVSDGPAVHSCSVSFGTVTDVSKAAVLESRVSLMVSVFHH